MRNIIFFLIVVICFHQVNGQLKFDDIDAGKVRHQKILTLLQEQKKINIFRFSDLKPSYKSGDRKSGFIKRKRSYFVKDGVENVWETYNHAHPAKIWSGKRLDFGFLYSRKADSILYYDCLYSGIKAGQIYYVDLKLLMGVYELATTFEVVKVDSGHKSFEFSYVNGTKSQGKQVVQLFETKRGNTKVVHSTLYKSDSKFRDKILYGFFHNKIIKEYHKNVRRNLIMANH